MVLLLNLPQDESEGFWSSWSALAEEPALLEFLIVLAAGVLCLIVSLRLARLARQGRERAALKDYLAERGIKGRVRYYGCPAEEGGAAKTFMVRAGLFDPREGRAEISIASGKQDAGTVG